MTSVKRIITILGTLFCALGIGFFMQHFLQGSARYQASGNVQMASVPQVHDIAPIPDEAADTLADGEIRLDEAALTSSVPVPPSAAPQPEHLPTSPVTLAALDDQPITEFPEEEPAPTFACDIEFSAEPAAAAMVNLTLSAPCLGNARFTLHHNGMMFSAVTDDDGHGTFTVPALSQAATFIATFATGDSAVAKAEVTALEYYDRTVVQWRGPDGLQIHALEYGADYGEEGHVWAGATRDLAAAARGEGGFIVRLGEPDLFNPLMAEVYTFPTGTALKEGDIRLSLEAEVTQANCGQDIEAQTLRKSGAGWMRVRDLLLAMPDCDALGDYLVLKNMFDDLNIARN